MPILGGHRPHEDADQTDIEKRGLTTVYKNYVKSNDIAKQLKTHTDVIRDYCELKLPKKKEKNFLGHFQQVLSKWVKSENIEAD